MSDLKQKTITGMKWSAIDRFGSQAVGFIISIIIARILSPSDYGLIGMITIFIGISNVFVSAGFGAALIRKQNRTETDFSTVFYYNLAVSILFYVILYLTAPLIARFYETPELTTITRVIGLNIIISSFGIIQSSKLNIAINFKTQTKISLISTLLAGTIGIILAYNGLGVWALVVHRLFSTFISTVLLWYFVRWIPMIVFSLKSFKELFGFGSKLMISALIDTIYQNIYQMVIGKKFSAAELGYFTRAKSLVQLPSSNITSVMQRVTFPVLSELQDDEFRLKNNYRKLLKIAGFIIFPIMIFLAVLGKPFIILILTEKWLPAVPMLQVLSISFMFYPIHAINLNLLKVKGRSDLFLRLEIIKKIMITIVLFFSTPFGVLAMCYGIILTSITALFLNTYYTGKLIEYGFIKQLKDLSPSMLISAFSGIVAFSPSLFFNSNLIQLILGGISGIIVFLGISYLFKIEELQEIRSILIRAK